ncbi:MAG TPA: ferric reductase-like transmembrane domain-containing protein [Candidatus Saccharimonadales bacterium]|nr:ferric reductase-like transmembrane domain-containing protein [Candidatus Saccharimonadales bacterium]
MNARKQSPWFFRLLKNSRFWILATAIVMSVNIAGFVQLEVPAGSLQTIRIEQIYGFVSLLLLYIAILASPLLKVFPRLPGKEAYLHARRAIGVSAFYYAFLHVYISFFSQLNGFAGVHYLNHHYGLSLLLGLFALGVLFIMAATSLDWVVDKMGYKHWKLLHRLVYLASVAVLVHVMLIGPHYSHAVSALGLLTYAAGIFLLALEALRIRQTIRARQGKKA